jgi:uncharacterized protein
MTPDVKMLVAASRSDPPHHATALSWLDDALANCARGERLRLLPVVMAGFPRRVTHPRVFVESTPPEAAHAFVGALLQAQGVELLTLGAEWPLLEPLCQKHGLTGNGISDGWIAAAVLARQECLATFDRDFRRLLPSRQLQLLKV